MWTFSRDVYLQQFGFDFDDFLIELVGLLN